jgi:hypothetical protein
MAIKELMGFILILILLWIIWFFTGGPQRNDNDKPYVTPAQNIGDIPEPSYK